LVGGVLGGMTAKINLKKQGPKVRAINKFREITNAFSMAVCLYRDKTNSAL
jgi:hypothetical protein